MFPAEPSVHDALRSKSSMESSVPNASGSNKRKPDASVSRLVITAGPQFMAQPSFLNEDALMAAKSVEPSVMPRSSAADRTISATSVSPFAESTAPIRPSEPNSYFTVHSRRFLALIASGCCLKRMMSREESSKSDGSSACPSDISRFPVPQG